MQVPSKPCSRWAAVSKCMSRAGMAVKTAPIAAISSATRCPAGSASASSPPSRFALRRLNLRQRHAALILVLPCLVLVGHLAGLVTLEEQHLRDALVCVDLRGQRRRVRDLDRHVPFPLRFE